jgi:hypothetical protein
VAERKSWLWLGSLGEEGERPNGGRRAFEGIRLKDIVNAQHWSVPIFIVRSSKS